MGEECRRCDNHILAEGPDGNPYCNQCDWSFIEEARRSSTDLAKQFMAEFEEGDAACTPTA